MTIENIESGNVGKKYLTQKELAERWRLSEGSIINRRKANEIPFYYPPGSHPLYPLEEIEIYESKYTFLPKEVMVKQEKAVAGVKGKPVMSNTNAQWRI